MNAWPMIQRCKEAQWRSFTEEEHAWMIHQSNVGDPCFIGLGHRELMLWGKIPKHPATTWISIKYDDYPPECEEKETPA